MSKVFIGSVFPTINRNDGLFDLITGQDIFGAHYQLIYLKWDSLVKAQQQAPKKMKTFDETQKGKKLKKEQTLQTQLLPDKPKPKVNANQESDINDEVLQARLKLKKRFSNSG